MALKIAINGFGRIGRCVTRLATSRDDIELVAINDIIDIDMMVYLLENDSVHGTFASEVCKIDESTISIDGKTIQIISEKNREKINFISYGAELVLESTGKFLTQEEAQVHIKSGIKKVLFSAPAQDTKTATFVFGVNEDTYQGQDIVSNASCTTNCLAPIAKVLDDTYGIEKGLITTIHSYTNDQNLLDANHKKDIRRSRAAAINMIPTTTGAAKAVNLVLPQLEGKLHGQSVRVPAPNVSMLDLNVVLKQNTTAQEVNALFKKMAETKLQNIMLIDEKMRVSQDFVGCSYSCVIAQDLTQVVGENMLKVMAWYDNEWGYSNRLLEMALHITK